MVPKAGLEPAHLSILDFESSASANSAIRAYVRLFIEDITATSIVNRILRVSTPLTPASVEIISPLSCVFRVTVKQLPATWDVL